LLDQDALREMSLELYAVIDALQSLLQEGADEPPVEARLLLDSTTSGQMTQTLGAMVSILQVPTPTCGAPDDHQEWAAADGQ
jgi:hypothetical protein